MSETENTHEQPNSEEPPANEAQEQPPPSSEPEAQPEPAKEEQPEAPEVSKEEDAKRTSSGVKKASEPDAGKKVDIETFMPPDFAPEKKESLPSRLPSVPGEPKSKSRFGTLGSKARIVLGSIIDIKANVVEGIDRRGPRYQNTYKLDSSNPFNAEKVDKILQEVMHEIIENLRYDPEKCSSTAKYASKQIRSKVKQLDFDRYKLVCVVTIGEKNSQDIFASCRFLWDTEKDRYSYYSLENTHVYAIAYCFGLYYE